MKRAISNYSEIIPIVSIAPAGADAARSAGLKGSIGRFPSDGGLLL
jgi:hypothetical protein